MQANLGSMLYAILEKPLRMRLNHPWGRARGEVKPERPTAFDREIFGEDKSLRDADRNKRKCDQRADKGAATRDAGQNTT